MHNSDYLDQGTRFHNDKPVNGMICREISPQDERCKMIIIICVLRRNDTYFEPAHHRTYSSS